MAINSQHPEAANPKPLASSLTPLRSNFAQVWCGGGVNSFVVPA
jgi:hypothetical protein